MSVSDVLSVRVKLASAPEPIVKAAFQLQLFVETGHPFAKTVTFDTLSVVYKITSSNLRPTSLRAPSTSAPSGGTRARSASVEAEYQPWPQQWAVDKSLLRTDIKKFNAVTTSTRSQLNKDLDQEPPSTGNSPEGSHTATPPESDSASSSSFSRAATRGTSADETIYSRPIGPKLPMASNLGFKGTQRAELRSMLAELVTSHPLGPPGPSGPQGPAGNDANGIQMASNPLELISELETSAILIRIPKQPQWMSKTPTISTTTSLASRTGCESKLRPQISP